MTWSRLSCSRGKTFAQYWQEFLSRSKTLLRVSFSSLHGSLSKKVRRITRGSRIVRLGVWTVSSSAMGGLWSEKLIQSSIENVRKSSS